MPIVDVVELGVEREPAGLRHERDRARSADRHARDRRHARRGSRGRPARRRRYTGLSARSSPRGPPSLMKPAAPRPIASNVCADSAAVIAFGTGVVDRLPSGRRRPRAISLPALLARVESRPRGGGSCPASTGTLSRSTCRRRRARRGDAVDRHARDRRVVGRGAGDRHRLDVAGDRAALGRRDVDARRVRIDRRAAPGRTDDPSRQPASRRSVRDEREVAHAEPPGAPSVSKKEATPSNQ